MTAESIKEFIEMRREIATRKCEIPSSDEIREATRWISDPETGISKTFLPHITDLAGKALDAVQITNILIGGYNASIATGEMSPLESGILKSFLTLYARSIIADKEVAQMVNINIHQAIELARIERQT